MRDALGPGTWLGYCTNVHAGPTLAEVKRNLETHACAVRAAVCPGATLGVGLWLAAPAAHALRAEADGVRGFADWLAERNLEVFTLNGFPYNDFHQPVVKHRVYEPNWTRTERLDYTIDLLHILAGLRPPGAEGSISTLPLGWPIAIDTTAAADAAAAQLRRVAEEAAAIEHDTGRVLHVDLEPEPGCRLERSSDVTTFFTDHLLLAAERPAELLRHLRVCHDVCHSAVMFEAQADALRAYAAEGIAVGKVQLSSALRIRFDALGPDQRRFAQAALASFAEDRYLHQTAMRAQGAEATDFVDDLPDALARAGEHPPSREWRVHFHVPLFAEQLGPLDTTQNDLRDALRLLSGDAPAVQHFEVETYAWNVLPETFRPRDLAAGIARELEWVIAAAQEVRAHS